MNFESFRKLFQIIHIKILTSMGKTGEDDKCKTNTTICLHFPEHRQIMTCLLMWFIMCYTNWNSQKTSKGIIPQTSILTNRWYVFWISYKPWDIPALPRGCFKGLDALHRIYKSLYRYTVIYCKEWLLKAPFVALHR